MPGKILVVDDEPEVRQLMEHFLTQRGYEVRSAENGQLALAALDTFR
jgi:two-component system, OmpR family, response regulator